MSCSVNLPRNRSWRASKNQEQSEQVVGYGQADSNWPPRIRRVPRERGKLPVPHCQSVTGGRLRCGPVLVLSPEGSSFLPSSLAASSARRKKRKALLWLGGTNKRSAFIKRS